MGTGMPELKESPYVSRETRKYIEQSAFVDDAADYLIELGVYEPREFHDVCKIVKLDPLDESITEWLRKQGYTGEFDRRYNVLILPLHMKGLFTYEAPCLRFSDHVPIDQMFIADMRDM